MQPTTPAVRIEAPNQASARRGTRLIPRAETKRMPHASSGRRVTSAARPKNCIAMSE